LACRVPSGFPDGCIVTDEAADRNAPERGGFTFRRRPTSVPPDIRPEWRIPLLLLMVRRCRGQVATREQLHVLNSAVLSAGSRRALLAALDGRLAPRSPALQFEPAFDRAIDRGVGLGLLVANPGGRLELTVLGRSVADAVDAEESLFTSERELLASLPRSLSQSTIRNALAERRMS
jgi:hypothetical protein